MEGPWGQTTDSVEPTREEFAQSVMTSLRGYCRSEARNKDINYTVVDESSAAPQRLVLKVDEGDYTALKASVRDAVTHANVLAARKGIHIETVFDDAEQQITVLAVWSKEG